MVRLWEWLYRISEPHARRSWYGGKAPETVFVEVLGRSVEFDDAIFNLSPLISSANGWIMIDGYDEEILGVLALLHGIGVSWRFVSDEEAEASWD